MKFLLDMPIGGRITQGLRNLGHDVLHARDIGLAKASDSDILKRAESEDRIVITMDLDFPRILSLTGAKQPGVILIRMRYPSSDLILKRLTLLLEGHGDDLGNAVTTLEDFRTRIRKLPTR